MPSAPSSISPEAVQAKISDLEGSTSLDDETKGRLLELYTRTRAAQDALDRHKTTAEQYARARETAAGEARAVREEMEQARMQEAVSEADPAEAASHEELEAMLVKAKAEYAAAEEQLAEIRQTLDTEADRPVRVHERLEQARERRETIAGKLTSAVTAGEPPAVREASGDALQSESLALSAEIVMLDQELLSRPMRLGLLEARRDINEHQLTLIGARIGGLERRLGELRVAEAGRDRQEAEQAQRLVEGKHPKIQALAARNAELAGEIEETTRSLDGAVADAEEAKQRASRVSEVFRSTRQKFELAGLTEALGRVMLEQRRRLTDTRELQRDTRKTLHALAQAGLRQIQYEEERQQLREPAAYLDELTEGMERPVDPVVEEELLKLAESRRELVTRALSIGHTYVTALGELDYAQRGLLDAAVKYRAFLDERLLWVRSSAGPNLEMICSLPGQLAEVARPANWYDVLRTLAQRATQSPGPALAILVLVAGAVTRTTMRRRLTTTGRYIRKPSRDRFVFTLQALGWTLLIAAPWPLCLYLAGRELGAALSASEFILAVSYSLGHIAVQFYILAAFREACVPGGVAELHFAWPEESLHRLRRRMIRFMWIFLPANFVTNLAVVLYISTMGGGLSWFGFLVLAGSLAAFAYSLLQPRTGVLQPHMQAHPSGLAARMNKTWLFLAVGLPLALALLATLGYRYTAVVLLERMVLTMYFVAGVVLLHQLSARWLVLSRRRLAVQAALARRRAAALEESAGTEGEGPAPVDGSVGDAASESEIDLLELGKETRQLLSFFIFTVVVVGVWMIWAEILPALGYLDQMPLWYRNGTLDGETVRLPVTLADVLLAVLIGVAMLVMIKRLPALLEIAVLQRLRLTPGARYAAKSLSTYVVVVLGLVIALSMLGITWSQLQWLVAALSVGIGFGLQEIVANFISGLIILFERPIRVGDVVTVGDTDGIVTRIRIRATTIRNWERKELLVPNKEFITSRLLNWSLSDQTTRLFVTVGLAYGGDVTRAMALMAAAAEAHEHVAEEPAPFVCFEGFGDSALILNLRCFTDSLEHRLQTTSELHERINADFDEAGLVIAFTQRDVHLDVSSPLQISLQQSSASAGAPAAERSETEGRP